MNNTSYKDPSGHVFKKGGIIYRQINDCGKDDFDCLMNSGLYEELVQKELLISHTEESCSLIKPEQIKYISYTYEWSFSMLKDSALLTLKILKTALKYEMTLKDASSYNVQFLRGKPVFIDTLSFERYKKDSPWAAYGQFCRHFLAPLALMSYTDISLNKLLINNIDGIPLDLTVKLLPAKAKLNLGALTHLILHAGSQKAHESDKKDETKQAALSRFAFEALIDSLESAVKSLKFPKINTEWGKYYENTNYTQGSFLNKKEIISRFIDTAAPQTLCDLGANRGEFTRIAAERGIETMAVDIDPVAVEDNYLHVKECSEKNILPILQDFNNPSPAIGFMNEERESFFSRFKCDTVMALALIHHLSISNNLPFSNTAEFFRKFGKYLIIEFVPKDDSKVQILLSSRKDIFDKYDINNFEEVYGRYFEILEKEAIPDSKRTLYLMREK